MAMAGTSDRALQRPAKFKRARRARAVPTSFAPKSRFEGFQSIAFFFVRGAWSSKQRRLKQPTAVGGHLLCPFGQRRPVKTQAFVFWYRSPFTSVPSASA